MNDRVVKTESRIELKDRKELFLDGVADILSFDENAVFLRTVTGDLSVEGEGLHINDLSLEKGTLAISGKIDGLFYLPETQKKKNGLFGRRS